MPSPFPISVLLLCLLTITTTSSAQTGAPAYPDTPPTGIRWGWQGYAQFDINSAAIRPVDRTLLLRVAEQMQRHPEISLLLTGHTDNSGDPDYNQRLSHRRSQAVADFIASQSVGLHRITQHDVGELRPVASNACERDRQRNRRVDLAYFPRHRAPPESGGRVFSPSRPNPNDEAEACNKRPPTSASRRSSAASGKSGRKAKSASASAESAGSASAAASSSRSGSASGRGTSKGTPAQASSPSATARDAKPRAAGSAPRWINPDDPGTASASASTPSSAPPPAPAASPASAPTAVPATGSNRSGGSGPGEGGAPFEPAPRPDGIEF